MAPLTVEKTRLLFGPYTLAVEVGWYDEIPFSDLERPTYASSKIGIKGLKYKPTNCFGKNV